MLRGTAPQRKRGAAPAQHCGPGLEGGLCSTPLQKYRTPEFDLLYRGFDGLDVSFVGQITPSLCAALEEAKQKAQETHQSFPLEWNGVKLLVSESGARGGYAFLASTGPFGETWFFKKPNPRDPWGVRASCNSFNLATAGLGGARTQLYRTLTLLEIHTESGKESISRVDYAIDFLAPKFVLRPELFVMHSNASRSDHIENPEVTVNGKSGRVTSVTVGKMPGRQVIVYDKRADVIAKRKLGWWVIWDVARAKSGSSALRRDIAAESRVWRVELRAGKFHLKERWGIRTWGDLDDRLGDMFSATLDAIRYAAPHRDKNRSRWPSSELWNRVREEMDADLFEMRSSADVQLVKLVEREAHDRLLARQMAGLLIARAAIGGRAASELPAFAISVGEEMADVIAEAHSRFEQKLTLAKGRYSLGLPPEGA